MSNRSWRPWIEKKVADLIREETLQLTSDQRAFFTSIGVPPRVVRAANGPGADGVSMWVVAQHGDAVLYWDSIEEEFGTGGFKSGVLCDQGLYGERLAWALEGLLRRAATRPSG